MNQASITPRAFWLSAVGLGIYLFAVTVKGVDETIGVLHNPLVLQIREVAALPYGVGLLLLLISTPASLIPLRRLPPSNIFLLIFMLVLIARLMADDLSPLKGLAALITLLLHLYWAAGYSAYFGAAAFERACVAGLTLWALLYTALTSFNYLTGYGINEGVGRFYGVTDHPNFGGVALAVATCVFLRNALTATTGFRWRFFSALCFLAAVYMCMSTASRTALLLLAISAPAIVLSIFRNQIRTNPLAIIGILCGVFSVVVYVAISATDDASERLIYTGDNRSEVWDWLWRAFQEYFFFGAGSGAPASESSPLKALATTGVVGGCFYTAFLVTCLFELFSTQSSSIENEPFVFWRWLAFGLLVASIFEGYLVELAGPWVLVMILASNLCARQQAQGYSMK